MRLAVMFFRQQAYRGHRLDAVRSNDGFRAGIGSALGAFKVGFVMVTEAVEREVIENFVQQNRTSSREYSLRDHRTTLELRMVRTDKESAQS
jgi:hypothetical protein